MKLRLIPSLVILCSLIHAQDFDVASIRPSPVNHSGFHFDRLPGNHELRASMPLDTLIRIAYRVPRVPLDCVAVKVKNAGWINEAWWDLDAKSEQPFTESKMLAMLQNLLAERFKLQIEKEQKPGPVYVLTVDPGGLKIKKSEDPTAYPRRQLVAERTGLNAKLVLRATAVTMSDLIFTSPFWELAAPVVDATGLVDRYDIEWVLGSGDEVLQPPNVIESCKRELGLKLQETKGKIDIINITHVEKPTAN